MQPLVVFLCISAPSHKNDLLSRQQRHSMSFARTFNPVKLNLNCIYIIFKISSTVYIRALCFELSLMNPHYTRGVTETKYGGFSN